MTDEQAIHKIIHSCNESGYDRFYFWKDAELHDDTLFIFQPPKSFTLDVSAIIFDHGCMERVFDEKLIVCSICGNSIFESYDYGKGQKCTRCGKESSSSALTTTQFLYGMKHLAVLKTMRERLDYIKEFLED